MFVLAFTYGKPIGIDVESLHRAVDIAALKTYLFTPAELIVFDSLQGNSRHEAFIRSWTRKESLLKATGEGLTRPLNELEIAFAQNGNVQLKDHADLQQTPTWFIQSGLLFRDYSLSISARGPITHVDYYPVPAAPSVLHKAG